MANLSLDNVEMSPKTTEILENTKMALGFIPNMYKKLGANTALLDAYTYSYKSFRDNAGFTPVEQEVIFLTGAYENNCEYCVAAHSFIADEMTKVPAEITDAIRGGQPINNPKLAALSKLTRLLTVNRGDVSKDEIDNFLAAGYSESHVLGIIAGIAVKAMSNYSNRQTNPELDITFAGKVWKSSKIV